MCIGKAMIIKKHARYPDYLRDSNSHTDIIKSLNLRDDKLPDRNFVKIECWPKASLTSTDITDWEFRIDEVGSLPSWFENKKLDWEHKCLSLLVKRIIPDWIKDGIQGNLDLRGTKVTTLGKLTTVGGFLDLRFTKVTTIGNVKVAGEVYK